MPQLILRHLSTIHPFKTIALFGILFWLWALPAARPGYAEEVTACAYNVTTEAQLNAALSCYNTEPAGSYTLNLLANITLTGATPLVNNPNGATLTVAGNGRSVDGAGNFRPFLVTTDDTVTFDNIIIRNGKVTGDTGGGGIFNSGTVTLKNSTLSGNSATFTLIGGRGGGIYNNGTLTILNSTLSGNSADRFGGGVYNDTGTITLQNTTLSANSAGTSGGGLNVNGGTVTLQNNTLSGNSAGTSGGGLFSTPRPRLSNNIIANSPSGGDCVSALSPIPNTNNLVEDGSCSPAFSGDPALGALANNGGPTQTHALLAGSAAIDRGSDNVCATVGNLDQRGFPRLNINGNANSSDNNPCDIGAFERLSGPCTYSSATEAELHVAIACYNVASVGSYTINLTADITLSEALTSIDNPNGANLTLRANGRIVDGTNTYRAFTVTSGDVVTFDTITVQNGSVVGDSGGSGLFNTGTVTIKNSTFKGNTATFTLVGGRGAGIYNTGNLTIQNSTLSENSADRLGGAVYNNGGVVTIQSSTISNNAAGNNGGGGIYNDNGTLNLSNTIVANALSGNDYFGACPLTNVHNLIEDGSCSPFISGDPKLGPLANNGGPTLTHALLVGSPAIDNGNNSVCAPLGNFDQRGFPRFSGNACDIGAFERPNTLPVAVADTAATNESANVVVAVLLNDSDADADTLAVIGVTTPGHGTATINAGTSVTYTPAPDFVGVDSFDYTISDGHGGTATATVTVTVLNVAPTVNVGPDVTQSEGQTLLVTGSFNDPGVSSWTGTVDYGDGTGAQPLALQPNKTFNLNHLYSTPGSYTVSVTVDDNHGGVGSDSLLVTVGNVAPLVNVGPDVLLYEGQTLSVGGSFSDPGANTWTATVNYGDGSGAQPLALQPDKTFSLSHLYSTAGSYTVSINVSDNYGGAGSDSLLVTVSNVAPLVNLGPDTIQYEGQTLSVGGSFSDPGVNVWTATVDYGDGAGAQPLALQPDKSFSLSHPYATAGNYTLSVQVSDNNGGIGIDSLQVTVLNVAPTVSAGPDPTLNEGQMLLVSGNFSDPGVNMWTATVDYGDGAGAQPVALQPDKTFSLSHLYLTAGNYTVSVSVSDDQGGNGSASLQATVLNVLPTVAVGADATLDEGQTLLVSGSFSDPGMNVWTGTVDYGDGTGLQPLALQPDKTFDLNHFYPTAGSYTVSVSISDNYSVGADALQVTVLNVAPSVNAGPDATLDEGQTLLVSGSFSDPGANAWTGTVDYGDGAGTQPLTLQPDKSFSLSHLYPTSGSYTVVVSVSDDHGGNDVDSLLVTVTNVTAIVNVGSDVTLDEGQTLLVNGSFSDPGVNVWSGTVDYGDGTGVQPLALHLDKSFNLAHLYPTAGNYTISVFVSDDFGGVGSAFLQATVLNVAPATNAGADVALNEGQTLSASGSFSDPGLNVWTATVDYGDGSGAHPLALQPDKTFGLSHLYATAGNYIVNVSVSDDHGGNGSDSLQVTVLNVVPAVNVGAGALLSEGQTLSAGGSFSDPGVNAWTAMVDYGDGTDPQPLTLQPDKSFNLSHLYSTAGSYTISVSVSDDHGGVGSDSLQVTVANVSPDVNAGPDALLYEGQTLSVGGSFSDPGVNVWTGTVDYGDGVGTQPLTLQPNKTFNLSHFYPTAGVYTVNVSVSDDHGGAGSDSLQVTALNVAPSVNVGADVGLSEGQGLLAGGSFSDPGVNVWTGTVDYGDGTGAQPLVLQAGKTFSLNHVYTAAGVYTVNVRVADDQGGIGADSLQVTVGNVAPVVNVGVDVMLYEGQRLLVNGSFSDPGANVWTGTVNYGDGTGTQPLALRPDKSFELNHVYPTIGRFTLTATISDNHGGVGSDSLQLTVLHGFAQFCIHAFTIETDIQDGSVVDCNIGSWKKLQVRQGAVVNGNVFSLNNQVVMGYDARVQGNITAAALVEIYDRGVVGGSVASGADIALRPNSLVAGNAIAAGQVTLGSGAAVNGIVTQGGPPPVMPPVTLVQVTVVAGVTDITVPNNTTYTLLPGAYKKLVVGEGATLNLQSGQYSFEQILLNKFAVLNMDLSGGNHRLLVDSQKNIDLKNGVHMLTNGAANQILFRSQSGHVVLLSGGVYVGTFLSPLATLELHEDSTLTGAWWAAASPPGRTSPCGRTVWRRATR